MIPHAVRWATPTAQEAISRLYVVEPACSLQPSQSGEHLGIEVSGACHVDPREAVTDGSCP